MCYPRSGEAFLAGDFGLGKNLARFKEPLPLDGLSEKFDHARCLRLPRRLGRASWRRDGTDIPRRCHSLKGSYVSVIKCPVWAEGYFDRLFEDFSFVKRLG